MKRRKRWSWPKWLWRWHYLVSAFVLFAGIGMLIASLQFDTLKHYQAKATSAEFVTGWIWADSLGWISLNDTNPGACPGGGCGTYGVTVNLTTREITGFGWSDKVGWICFGTSCQTHPECVGAQPSGPAMAYISSGSGILDVHGWAKVCSEGSAGWISLNCHDPGACASYAYGVKYNTATKYFNGLTDHPKPNTSSLAWNGNSDGSGFGYITFEYANLTTPTEPNLTPGPPESNCHDGVDNDLNGLVDCADSACKSNSVCQELVGVTDFWGEPLCRNGIDDNGDGDTDCRSNGCASAPECQETPTNTDFSGTPLCANGFDDNLNGSIDCADAGCSTYYGCATAGSEPSYSPTACHDSTDNDGDGKQDCEDPACQTFDLTCTPAWLQAKFGNVYAQQGITGSTAKSSQATYCLTSKGAISGFTSGSDCLETNSVSLSLPKGSTQYQGTLGSIDINGILAGRYGQVVTLNPGDITASLPENLAGKVYYVPGNATLGAKTFLNGSAATDRGNGLLIVKGTLTINGAGTVLDYAPLGNVTALRNLASFGVIVMKNSSSTGGIINISPTVTKIVGAYFAEDTINTGTTGGTDQALTVYGLMAAYRLNLQRNYRDPVTPAEQVIFDGRAVANPPPGMGDVTKSLPASHDAF